MPREQRSSHCVVCAQCPGMYVFTSSSYTPLSSIYKRIHYGDFPGGPVAKTLHS